ncbi:hypothetical protein MXB_2725, partial [Myxobolus squamalis]
MIERVLPLATAYYKCVKYLESFIIDDFNLKGYPPCYGTMVQQALSSAIFNIQKEYLSFICQLEFMFRQGDLNLQKLLYLKESCITEMEFVASICSSINIEGNDTKSVLCILHDKLGLAMSSGICLNTCEYLMQIASKPYFDMIFEWIYNGIVQDYYDEFMISKISEPQFYNKNHSLKISHILIDTKIPSFLE